MGFDVVIDRVHASEANFSNNLVDSVSSASIDNMLMRAVLKALPNSSLVNRHLVCHCGGNIDSRKLRDVEQEYGDIGEFPCVKVASGVKLGQLPFKLEDCLSDSSVRKGAVSPSANEFLNIGYCPR